tara:strand:- start:9 stop:386 length:378 start_codon:yes stop_codon:yes gene_type:complete
MRKAISAAIIQDRRILLVRKKDSWIFPGGKPLETESAIQCLHREAAEELSGTRLESLMYYKKFTGIAPHQGDEISIETYFAKIKGFLNPPSNEILEVAWTPNPESYNLSDVTEKIIYELRQDRLL